ncbi:hypothetical protein VC83_08241 [Pseudogymnoascus destructans]|uniref:Uncharacterized protein n=1 Tax=Pseudogymnoascus destructans TaxID=655981 RepID=A0A176ZZL0_9PEZI|nr:uncharacterized protein VC83_08241 [Pseudogymnoascus destructans]OAF55356.1 hypothetical protein VC83_08241 [Pseudogymnoascus destructans]
MSGWEDHSDADDDGNSVFGEAPLPPANIQQVAEQIAQGLLNLDESMEPADDEFDNPDSYSVELPVEDSVPDEDFLPIGDAPPDDDPGLEMPPPARPETETLPRNFTALSEEFIQPQDDRSEPVGHKQASNCITDFEMYTAMWCEKYSIPGDAYAGLLEGYKLVKSIENLMDLPKDVRTLKKRLISQLPLISQRHKLIDVNQEKLRTMSPAERSQAAQKRRADMHWVDLSSLVTRLLSSKDFVGGLHSGFGAFADAPTEMWESEAWLCSIRTTSGATISYEDGSPILCSDFVRYRGERFGQHIGRVFAIGIDRRACAATKDEVLVQIQPVYTRGSLPPTMKDAINGKETPLSRRFLSCHIQDAADMGLVVKDVCIVKCNWAFEYVIHGDLDTNHVLRRNKKAGQLQDRKEGGRMRPALVPGGAAGNSSSESIT